MMDISLPNQKHAQFLNEFHSHLTAELMLRSMQTHEERQAISIQKRKKELDDYYVKNINFIKKCSMKSIAISSFTMKAIEVEGQEIKNRILEVLVHNT